MDSPQITAQFSTEMRDPFDFPTEIFLPGFRRLHAGKNFQAFPCKVWVSSLRNHFFFRIDNLTVMMWTVMRNFR